MKPVVFYVDDEPRNLTVFEAALPETWAIHTFDNPIAALEALEKLAPAVIVTDQRMPNISGVKFLQLASKIHPQAVRIIATGYSDENQIIESVRKAQIFDYIVKPWDPTDLEASISRAISYYEVNTQKEKLLVSLRQREAELSSKNEKLMEMTNTLRESKESEESLRKELECWVPPFVLWAIRDHNTFPMTKDLVGITFDIVKSVDLHGHFIRGQPVRNLIIQMFSELIIKHGGWRESHSGDSAYGHFGILEQDTNAFESALAVAREFRAGLRSLSNINQIKVECGIAVHLCRKCLVDIHQVQISTPRGVMVQKSFDTSSADIDFLHRMEKLVHPLDGSNIILSEDVLNNLSNRPDKLQSLGEVTLSGSKEPIKLHLIPSDQLGEIQLRNYIDSLSQGFLRQVA